jgi:hypothetical protein
VPPCCSWASVSRAIFVRELPPHRWRRSPRYQSPRAITLAYAAGVKDHSPGQVTASFRAVTPPWGVSAKVRRSSAGRGGPRGRCRDRKGPRHALEFRATSVGPWVIQWPHSRTHAADRQSLTKGGRFAGPDGKSTGRPCRFRPRQDAIHRHVTCSADALARPTTQGGAYVRCTHVRLPWASECNAFSVYGAVSHTEPKNKLPCSHLCRVFVYLVGQVLPRFEPGRELCLPKTRPCWLARTYDDGVGP